MLEKYLRSGYMAAVNFPLNPTCNDEYWQLFWSEGVYMNKSDNPPDPGWRVTHMKWENMSECEEVSEKRFPPDQFMFALEYAIAATSTEPTS